MTAHELVRIAAGPFAVELSPAAGGSIARWQGWGRDLLRPTPAAAIAARDPLGFASYVLIPFSNRVRDARFGIDGQQYQLAPNFPPEPHAIHGNAWRRAWRLAHADAAAARLELSHEPARDGAASWPFAYAAAQTLTIGEAGLEVQLALTNQDARRMPAGVGLHPFFPLTAVTRLTAGPAAVWQNDAQNLPAQHTAVPAAWDFRHGEPVAALSVDNCFTGWNGRAVIDWPDRRLRMTIEASSALRNLVLFVPRAHDYFCVEPVSNVNDGFNLAAAGVPDTGVVVLEPGQTLDARIRFSPQRL
jgi:aldose 1-epimerase